MSTKINIFEHAINERKIISNKEKLCNILKVANSMIATKNKYIIQDFINSLTEIVSRKLYLDFLCDTPPDITIVKGGIGILFSQEIKKNCAEKIINLYDGNIISIPWRRISFEHTFSTIGSNLDSPFEYKKNNHKGLIIAPLNIVIMTNGYHSSMVGILKHEGEIYVDEVFELNECFNDWIFDGDYFINTNINRKIEMPYFELGVLFEVARILHNNDINLAK